MTKTLTHLFGIALLFQGAIASADHGVFQRAARELQIPLDSDGECVYTTGELTRSFLQRQFSLLSRKKDPIASDVDLQLHWRCIALQKSLKRDLTKNSTLPHQVFSDLQNGEDRRVAVEGKIRYLGFAPRAYRYDLHRAEGITTAEVKIHFRPKAPISAEELAQLDQKLSEAEKIWNDGAVILAPNLRFHFQRLSTPENAHFSVRLLKGATRGPYDKRWSLEFSSSAMAHEIGHMLGLDDEYQNLRVTTFTHLAYFEKQLETGFKFNPNYVFLFSGLKQMRCDPTSIMCYPESSEGISSFHLYTIFKRFFFSSAE